ncbi:MAG: hypothetical protein PHP86_16280 [Nevskiales bacterium]|nr:hypothetical protein [Nevskiales bacterium]
MHVAESTLERALLDLFAAPGLGRLSMLQALQRWRSTGLRDEDFRDAVRILIGRHFLSMRPDDVAPTLELTPAGQARLAAAAYRVPTMDADLEDLRTLRVIRRRQSERHASAWSGADRRERSPSTAAGG